VLDPIEAHGIYTHKLGFITKEFEPDAQLAIVTSAQDPDGAAILLEPCKGSFAEKYQQSAFAANLPIMAFSAANAKSELERLKCAGVKLRPDIDHPDFGIMNVFEDGCGNLLMIEDASS